MGDPFIISSPNAWLFPKINGLTFRYAEKQANTHNTTSYVLDSYVVTSSNATG